MQASLLRDHFATMTAIAEKGVEQTMEWSAVGAKLADKFSSGETVVRGLVEKERQEVADRLKAMEQEASEP
jgi:hypothetical protein